MSSSEFRRIAEDFIPARRELRRCPDQMVGFVKIEGERTAICSPNPNDFSQRVDAEGWMRPKGPAILVILESPHIAEYSLERPGPAAGSGSGDAGRALRQMFGEVLPLHDALPEGKTPLVLMNAIQFQCSLGLKPEYLRTQVFLRCWDTFGRRDFERRLRALYRPADVVINCCTADKLKGRSLREVVEVAIRSSIQNGSARRVEHPANWARERNRAAKEGRLPNYEWKVSAVRRDVRSHKDKAQKVVSKSD